MDSKMKFERKGISTAAMGAIAVVAIIVVGAGAYLAASGGSSTTTVTSTQSASTSTVTSTTSNVITSTQTISGIPTVITSTQFGTVTSTATTTATQVSTTTSISTTSSALLPAATVNGGGGTLVYPLMQAWQNTYTNYVQKNIQVNYAAVGSGKGIAGITSGLYNFGESDAPLTAAQYAALPSGSNLLTIPISDSGIIPAYNIPGIPSTTHINFTGNILAEIFYGTIAHWNDARLQAINPGVTLPSDSIKVYHRSDGSGTMYGFTQYLSDSNSTWRNNVGFSTGVLPWPVGVGCLHNDGVAQCIANNAYSIGPLEIAYEIANPGAINYGAVQNAAGNYVLASLDSISAAMAAGVKAGLPSTQSAWSSYSVIQQTFNDTTDSNIYPISTFTYGLIYQNLSAQYASTTQAQAVATINFLYWIVNSGQASGNYLGYAPMPSVAVTLDNSVLATITYNGSPIATGP